ncbi:MAG: hypothetical protein ABSF26_29730 [Thermoguttaceae bacterium]|jgi:hypothetical protein
MSILVVCPGCKKSFQVHDKFAGKSGPCPKCKATIRVPAKAEEVKVHGGEDFATGGRSVEGKLVLKPIGRTQVQIRPLVAGAFAAAAAVVVGLAWADRWVGLLQSLPLRALGLLVISPVLVLAAYTFLRDDELEPYRGRELYLRIAACAAVYLILWAGLGYVRPYLSPDEIWQWVIVVAPLEGIGTMAACLALDLEPGNGCCHYTFYLLTTVLLGWIGGLGWVWAI